jgi:hypothetical protein
VVGLYTSICTKQWSGISIRCAEIEARSRL